MALAAQLPAGSTYYLDTEFDSRASGTKLCLLQLRVGDETHLIDTLSLRDLSSLAPALGHTDSTWVLHAAHQDMPLLLTAFGLSIAPRVFDTQIAFGLIGPEPATSFTYLTYRLLGIRSSKFHQTDDWTRRPLSESQMAYAAHDVDHLPLMHEILLQRIAELRRIPVVLQACHEHLCGPPEPVEPITLESYRNAWQLEPAGQRTLRELIRWYNSLDVGEREQTLESKLLWSLANRLPRTPEALRQVRGLPRLNAQHQERILSIVRDSLQELEPMTTPLEPLPYATFERLELEAWLEYVRTMACAKAQVSKELVLSGRRLRNLKESALKNGRDTFTAQSLEKIIGTWQYSLIGEELLEAARRISHPASLFED